MFASNTMYERYTPEPHNAGRDIQSVVGILNFIRDIKLYQLE